MMSEKYFFWCRNILRVCCPLFSVGGCLTKTPCGPCLPYVVACIAGEARCPFLMPPQTAAGREMYAAADGRMGVQQHTGVSEEPLKQAIRQAQALIDSISKEAKSEQRQPSSSAQNASAQGDGAAATSSNVAVFAGHRSDEELMRGAAVRG